ncbi:hypothetical protein [Leclercia adecarboxylata]|uniref:hypothetical protein n=1 Tax=Leclercia adecarboxylata TaxID=83655 RepID=UPI0021CF7AB6|nr:hypothetical protein [Leclercia adecarboxylata]MCU6673669.1 hypothetical protein [Leclercia adecarboxylata]MCV3305466.1 hypothetical protein [Leclercia adecarboxylata]MCV3309860.1 hypothetical protein [Leclercia adecarboxylata]
MAKVKESSPPLPGVKQNHTALQFEYDARRFGFVLLLLIITAALAGVFSGGYFSDATKTNAAKSVQVKYQRFGRLQTPLELKITLPGQGTAPLTLRVGGEYMARTQTDNIWPQPDEMHSEGGELVLVYQEAKSRKDFNVWIYNTPDKPGKTVTTVTVNNQPGLSFWQFIYP